VKWTSQGSSKALLLVRFQYPLPITVQKGEKIMSDLLEQIKKDRLAARKDRTKSGKIKATILTTLVGEIETLEKSGKTVDTVAVIKKFVKGIDETLKLGYNLQLETEKSILNEYLPTQMDEERIMAFVKPIVSADTVVTMGDIMGYFSKHFKGLYDGKLVSRLAREELIRKGKL
jgi:uncharacterized protein YqeY